jgi:hypothetical protein
MSIDKKEDNFFRTVFKLVEKGEDYLTVSDSFEDFYNIIEDALNHFEITEEYEKCAILKKYMDDCIKEIPTNIDEALDFLATLDIRSLFERFKNYDEFTFSIELHPKIGKRLIDIWLLKYDISPMRKYFLSTGEINPENMAHKIIKAFIVKARTFIENEIN